MPCQSFSKVINPCVHFFGETTEDNNKSKQGTVEEKLSTQYRVPLQLLLMAIARRRPLCTRSVERVIH